MAQTVKREASVLALLTALECELLNAEGMARSVERALWGDCIGRYRLFRRKIDDLRSIVVLIEDGIQYIIDRRQSALRQQFEFLELLLLTMIIRCYKDFFAILTQRRAMPLGAHEIFSPDLNILVDARDRLNRADFADRVDVGLKADLEETVVAIKAVIDRVAPLPVFIGPVDGEPPASPEELRARALIGADSESLERDHSRDAAAAFTPMLNWPKHLPGVG